jgi:hypothetical protein
MTRLAQFNCAPSAVSVYVLTLAFGMKRVELGTKGHIQQMLCHSIKTFNA